MMKAVYTCNVCETRNMVEVKTVAWDEGTVIATCQGCENRHVLADNKGRMDLSNWTGFSLANRTTSLRQGDLGGPMDAAKLAALGLAIDSASGKIVLARRPGDVFEVVKDRVSAVGPAVDDALKRKATGPGPALPLPGYSTASDAGQARRDDFHEPLEIEVPVGVEEGDLLQLATSTGVMMVTVPAGAKEGARLAVLGCIEFTVPAGTVGQVVLLQTPAGDELPIAIPENASPGSFLQVGYPVEILAADAPPKPKWE